MENYRFRETEEKWQKVWNENKIFSVNEDTSKPKYYVLEMFPYPSGNIHMGHLRNYAIGDVIARFKKMQGYNVLHPIGWDAFGLPAENAAIENDVHPSQWTYKNIETMKNQLKKIGFSYDWDREIKTCDPDYFKHEQKMFLDFLENGIAYQKEATVNWDPIDNTVLANEQVVDGRGWRSGALVERKKLKQWFLNISEHSEELLQSLKTLDKWPEKVKTMQERWIGKSQGLIISFDIENKDKKIDVYTTRPDTIFGASFLAISPNHPLVLDLFNDNDSIKDFVDECNKIGMAEEVIEKTEKKGFDTGLKISHPFDESIKLPLYIANFVLMDYGTGAVFGCPAHDQRDLDFARKYNLNITKVIEDGSNSPIETEAYTGLGTLINSSFLDGLTIEKAKEEVINRIESNKLGIRKVNYRLRDWGISRQRYWGCPIPIIYCDDCGTVPVPETDLPVELPKDVDFEKTGNPLDHHPTWKYTTCPKCGKHAIRETDTFDTFFESSWYFARYCSPKSEQALDKEKCDYWLSVDQYIGGIEHAVLHLLYARFFTLALNKCGYISQKEPFKGLLTQGMVCHETYQDQSGKWVFPEDIKIEKDKVTHLKTGENIKVGRSIKMSKSKKNVIDPTLIVDSYGADTARLFMLSDSPPERDLEWSDSGVEGIYKYINKLWNSISDVGSKSCKVTIDQKNTSNINHLKVINKTIDEVTGDLQSFRFNKAIARIRELTNSLSSIKTENEQNLAIVKEGYKIVIKLLSPFIPHMCEDLWNRFGNDSILSEETWPIADKKYLQDDNVTIAVQINGKLKSTIQIAKDLSKEKIEELALTTPKIKDNIGNKNIKKVIVVPGKIVNVVI